MPDLDTIPDPPDRLAEFRPGEWPLPVPGGMPVYDHTTESFTDRMHHTSAELAQREQWRHAREAWAAEHGLAWTEAEQILARARARLRARRAAAWQPVPPEAATPEQPNPLGDQLAALDYQPPAPPPGVVVVDPDERHPAFRITDTPAAETPGGAPPSAKSALPRSAAAPIPDRTGDRRPGRPQTSGERP